MTSFYAADTCALARTLSLVDDVSACRWVTCILPPPARQWIHSLAPQPFPLLTSASFPNTRSPNPLLLSPAEEHTQPDSSICKNCVCVCSPWRHQGGGASSLCLILLASQLTRPASCSTMSAIHTPSTDSRSLPALLNPALPCPALPCPALPSPTLPCSTSAKLTPAVDSRSTVFLDVPCAALPCPVLPCPCPALPCSVCLLFSSETSLPQLIVAPADSILAKLLPCFADTWCKHLPPVIPLQNPSPSSTKLKN